MKKIIFGLSLAFGLTLATAGFNNAAAQTVKTETKTGMSKKKKGAIVGAGAGAVTGAVVSKNRTKGAVVGGVVGGAGGYLYGRHKAKKNPTRKTVYKTTVKQ
ncbi:MAG TPA: YMGG-like glycine zipper-containing protein [Chitinophagaceae bacterium]|nr:YMGG-like glycine zipper-containing protein [Chitinophagaceae bacterium]